jgi:uncharacterized membrane protein YuzA (DUF378 family)
MNSMRKYVLIGLAALMVCAVAASAASATTVRSVSAAGSPYTGSVSGSSVGSTTLTSSSLGTVTCTGSTFAGSTNSSGTGTLTSLAYSGCTNVSGNCTVSTTASPGSPWSANPAFDAGHSGGRDGTMTVTVPTNGATVTCSVFGFPLTCKYSRTAGLVGNMFNPTNAGALNSKGTVKFSSVTLTGDTCGDTATWNANYNIVGAGNVNLFVTA